jgi:hypothetical protein
MVVAAVVEELCHVGAVPTVGCDLSVACTANRPSLRLSVRDDRNGRPAGYAPPPASAISSAVEPLFPITAGYREHMGQACYQVLHFITPYGVM